MNLKQFPLLNVDEFEVRYLRSTETSEYNKIEESFYAFNGRTSHCLYSKDGFEGIFILTDYEKEFDFGKKANAIDLTRKIIKWKK